MGIIQTFENIGIGAGAALGVVGVITAIIKLISWIRKRRERKRLHNQQILDGLEALKKGQLNLWVRFEEMDKLRCKAREEDSVIRGYQYLGTIAVIAAIKELAEGLKITINGEVEKYYQQNIDALRHGLGMIPLESKKEGL